MQVKLSGAGKWPYFTSAYRNPLFQNTPNFVRGHRQTIFVTVNGIGPLTA